MTAISGSKRDTLFSGKKKFFNEGNGKNYDDRGDDLYQRLMKTREAQDVFKCNKIGYMKKNYCMMLKSSNVAKNEGGSKSILGGSVLCWRRPVACGTSINFEDDWILIQGAVTI